MTNRFMFLSISCEVAFWFFRGLVQESFEFGAPQQFQGTRLDLAHALPGHPENASDLLESHRAVALQPKPELQDLGLTVGGAFTRLCSSSSRTLMAKVSGRRQVGVFDEVAEFERILSIGCWIDTPSRWSRKAAHLLAGHACLGRNFQDGGFPAVHGGELSADPRQLVDLLRD